LNLRRRISIRLAGERSATQHSPSGRDAIGLLHTFDRTAASRCASISSFFPAELLPLPLGLSRLRTQFGFVPVLVRGRLNLDLGGCFESAGVDFGSINVRLTSACRGITVACPAKMTFHPRSGSVLADCSPSTTRWRPRYSTCRSRWADDAAILHMKLQLGRSQNELESQDLQFFSLSKVTPSVLRMSRRRHFCAACVSTRNRLRVPLAGQLQICRSGWPSSLAAHRLLTAKVPLRPIAGVRSPKGFRTTALTHFNGE